MRWGAGAGASRLISGNMTPHRRLEERAGRRSRATRRRCCSAPATSPTSGVIAALAGRGEVVFSDELNHASIIDGCRLARAETFVYRHGDVEHLAWGLRQAGGRGALIVTDGVFSMDGDVAPLAELVELARRHDGRADGRRGARDRRARARAAAARSPRPASSGEVDVVVGTLGKALGSYGAYVCATPRWRLPRQHARARHLLDRAAAARGRRRRWRRSSCSSEPRRVERLQAQRRRRCAPRSPSEGLDVGAARDPDRPARRRRRRRWRWSLRAGARARASSPRASGRRPCPRAPRACASR